MKFAQLRLKLAKWIAPRPKQTEASAYKTLSEELQIPQDAAVETDGPDEQWQPEQHGNVVVVEPDLMFQHRRGKL